MSVNNFVATNTKKLLLDCWIEGRISKVVLLETASIVSQELGTSALTTGGLEVATGGVLQQDVDKTKSSTTSIYAILIKSKLVQMS